jgi:hypothetical protein
MKDFGRWGVVIFLSTIYLGICLSVKGFAQDPPPGIYSIRGVDGFWHWCDETGKRLGTYVP